MVSFRFSVFSLILFLFSFQIFGQEKYNGNDFFIEGVREYTSGDINKAETLFKESIKYAPDNDAAYYYLGIIFEDTGRNELAESNYKRAYELDPGNFWYRITLARFYVNNRDTELALSLYEKICSDFPSKSSVYYEIIDLYTHSGQIDKALETLDRIESLRGVNEATGNARYQLLTMQGKYDEAAAFLEKFDKDYPTPQTAYILGDIYKSKFVDSTAINYYSKALAMDPSYAPAYLGLAEVYRMKRQFPKYFSNINMFLSNPDMDSGLKADYMKEVILNPQFVQAFMPQVDTMMLSILDAHPSDSTSLLLAGSYYVQTDRLSEGIELYHKNISLYPDVMSANMEYISLLYYKKLWDPLINQVEKTLQYFPDDISILEIKAIAFWQKEDYDNAIATYNGMIKMLPKDSPLLVNCYTALGDLYQLQDNPKKTISNYEKGYKADPTYIPLLNNYAYYLSLTGKNLKKALEMSKKTIKSEPDNPTYLDTYAWLLYLSGDADEAKDYFKHAMLYGGKENAVILDHYADVLFTLKEYDLAFIYWDQAHKMDTTLGIAAKIATKKEELKK